MDNKPLIFFGVTGTSAGHYFAGEGGPYSDGNARLFHGLNRHVLAAIDGTFAPGNTREQGLYQVSIVPPVMIVSWWDYTVDSRPGSNANLVGMGFADAEEIIDAAYKKFPHIMGRMKRPHPITPTNNGE